MLAGYVRHRDRMVQQSVFEDLRDTLIACRWMAGTTAHAVFDPADPESGPQILTTGPTDVLPLMRGDGITLIDYFPEAEGDSYTTSPNTFALDNGTPGEPTLRELGSTEVEQPYVFNMAFFASSDAVALAVLNDLRDRYNGWLIRNDVIDLWDYNGSMAEPVVRMEIDNFRYSQNSDQIAPAEVHLYFAELTLTDFAEGALDVTP